jgi:membrane protease YdiL (CAAX protease family)
VSGLPAQHLDAVLFYAILLAFERVRRTPALALIRHPMLAYLARGALVAIYFALAGTDPLVWFAGPAADWIVAGAIVAVALAVLRRRDVATLARADPGMVLQATYLALAVALVEELIFRGAFVLVAAVTPPATVLAAIGSSVAYVVWRAIAYRDRDARSLALVFAAALGLGLLAGLTRSLWAPLLAHAAYVLFAGPPRAPARATPTPSAVRR